LQDIINVTPLNPVLWTLFIEIKFYIIVSLVMLLGGGVFTPWNTLMVCCLCLAEIYGVHEFQGYLIGYPRLLHFLQHVEYSLANIIYILCGTLLYLVYSRQLRLVTGVVLVLAFCLFSDNICEVAILQTPWNLPLYKMWEALACFVICLSAAPLIVKEIKPLMMLGNISYPLYLTHMPVGMVVMGYWSRLSGNAGTSLFAALVISIMISIIIHKVVEVPANRYGKSLASRYFGDESLTSTDVPSAGGIVTTM
jgi:peptidoglycan/LPS O-acetylase OafA/YrhL